MTKTSLSITLLFVSCSFGISRSQNLVPNYSFEEYTSCPRLREMALLKEWNKPIHPSWGADYFTRCTDSMYHIATVPWNYLGSEEPATGDAYVGLMLVYFRGSDYREYISVKLKQKLTKGTRYKISFKYSLADNSKFIVDNFGIHFSKNNIYSAPSIENLIGYTPQVRVNSRLDKTDGWELLSFCYVAAGDEAYITLGNFDPVDSTHIKINPKGRSERSYVYIDDVSLTVDHGPPDLGKDTIICRGDSLVLKADPDLGHISWNDGTTDPVKYASDQGTYWVHVKENNCYYADTMNLYILQDYSFGIDTMICLEHPLFLSEATGFDLTWKNSDGQEIDFLNSTGEFIISASNNKCTAIDTFIILETTCECLMHIPNAFTPNEDGLNDQFKVISSCDYDLFALSVFDQWGELIFKTHSIETGWNGTYKGEMMPTGKYPYVVENGEEIKRGVVQLMR